MNDPPTERLTMSTAVTWALSRNRKTNAVASAAIPSGHSTSAGRARTAKRACLMVIAHLSAAPRATLGRSDAAVAVPGAAARRPVVGPGTLRRGGTAAETMRALQQPRAQRE
jgi:hypothetical protein